MTINKQFQVPEKIIGPGDYYSSLDNIVISTLLGSCIAVALYDVSIPVGGLNHFMLPESKTGHSDLGTLSARFGINAMELLMNDIFKKGGAKRQLHAKVFGGSTMLDFGQPATINVSRMNIEFVFQFLETEKIPVDSYSVGGEMPRKVFFFPHSSRILMKYSRTFSDSVSRRENVYAHALLESVQNKGRQVLF